MSNIILPGATDNDEGIITAILLDEGKRLVAICDVSAEIKTIMMPVDRHDDNLVSKIVPDHRPRDGKPRWFEFRGQTFKTPHSKTKLRVYVERRS